MMGVFLLYERLLYRLPNKVSDRLQVSLKECIKRILDDGIDEREELQTD